MKVLPFRFVTWLAWFSALPSVLGSQPGSLDITFNPGSGPNGEVYCITLNTNHQVLVGGSFSTVNGVKYNNVARLNPDGSVDSSFIVGQGPSGRVNCIAVQPDGRVIIGGEFGSVNNIVNYGVARLRKDGSDDIDFRTSTFVTTAINAVSIQGDGGILIAGTIHLQSGSNVPMARLLSNGSFDFSFHWATTKDATLSKVTSMVQQSNGQIIVAVPTITVDGVTRTNVARLNSDGTVDPTFVADPIVGGVNCVEAYANGKVLIGGNFTTVNGYTRQGIARLNSDGTLDTSFGRPYSPYSPSVSLMVVLEDGRVLIYDNVGANPHCLSADGRDDASFSSGTGVNYGLHTMVVQPDGQILIGGSFTSFNSTTVSRLARLHGAAHGPTGIALLAPQLCMGMWLSGTVSNTYRIENSSDLEASSPWTPLLTVTLQTNNQLVVDPNPAAAKRYYRAVQVNP